MNQPLRKAELFYCLGQEGGRCQMSWELVGGFSFDDLCFPMK